MIKKIIALITTLVCCMGALSFTVSAQAETEVDALNSSRGENQLIIYTPDYGATTETNEWGTEAVVDGNGVIISINSAGNSAIPSDGFVVSGHGTMKQWVLSNCKKGMYCYFSEYTMQLLVSEEPVNNYGGLYYTVERKYDNINGTRYTDNIIIYTQGSSTNTNEWGYEVQVGADGRVIAVGGNNRSIPKGGFVISGHGAGAEWLTLHAAVGMTAKYDTATKNVILSMDESAYTTGIEINLSKLKDAAKEGKEEFLYYNYEYIENVIKTVEDIQDKIAKSEDEDETSQLIGTANDLLEKGISACCESKPVEYRGVWVRPSQKTKAEVSAYVQRLFEAGINTVCVETLFDSTLIYPPAEGSYFEMNPAFGSFNVLQAYIDECHARGMELHVWMPVFYSGHYESSNYRKSVWYKNPEWRAINDSGKDTCVKDTSDFCFLNPAIPEVTEFLLDTYRHLLENYDIDGFELDYIRYQDNAGDDYGYDETTVNGFKEKYGVTPKYDTSASYWNNWVQYRCDLITDFVADMRALFDEVAPDVLLCADVGTDPIGAKNSIYQDYGKWMKEGWIDLLKPMSYNLTSVEATGENVDRMNGKYLASGIGIFESMYDGPDGASQTAIAIREGADGVMFFEAATFLGKQTGLYLTENGAFRNMAVTPSYDTNHALKRMAEYAIGRIDQVIIPYGGMTEAQCKNAKDKLTGISEAVGKEQKADLCGMIEDLCEALPDTKGGHAVEKDLEFMLKILENCNSYEVGKEDVTPPAPDDFPSPEVSDTETSETEEPSAPDVEQSKDEQSEKPENSESDGGQVESDGQQSESESSEADGQKGGFAWWWIPVALCVAAAAVVLILIFKRK